MSACNVYLTESGQEANARLLQTIAQYLTHLFHVFGVVPTDQDIGFPLQQEGAAKQVRVYRGFLCWRNCWSHDYFHRVNQL